MTIIQSINPMTSKTAGTIEGASAGALLGAGAGYMIARKPSEDTFIKNAVEFVNKELIKTRNTAGKILKKMYKNEPVSTKLLELIADQDHTVEELSSKENVRKLFVETSSCIDVVNNGKRWENALKRWESSTHPDKAKVTSKIKTILDEVIKPAYENCMNELKTVYKDGAADETYREISGWMKKKYAGRFAAIGAVGLGVAGYFASRYFANKK